MIFAVPDFVEELDAAGHAAYLRGVLEKVFGSGVQRGVEDLRLYVAYCALGGLAVMGELGSADASAALQGLRRFWRVEGELRVGQTPWLLLPAEQGPDLISLLFLTSALDLLGEETALPREEVQRWLQAFAGRKDRVWDLRAAYAFTALSQRYGYTVSTEMRRWLLESAVACRCFDGGYAFDAGCESHAAATFLCVAMLRLLEQPLPDRLLTLCWLAARQADWGFNVT